MTCATLRIIKVLVWESVTIYTLFQAKKLKEPLDVKVKGFFHIISFNKNSDPKKRIVFSAFCKPWGAIVFLLSFFKTTTFIKTTIKKSLRLAFFGGTSKMRKKLRLILCILGWHKKKLYVGGYRCEFCGKYVKGYKQKLSK